jgi:anti-sigma factor ChrR (cupin superfamily)
MKEIEKMKEKFLDTKDMEWQDAPRYTEGTKMKILRDENGARTILLNICSNFDLKEHTHTCTEQHYILEGEYEADGKTYGSGTYQLIPAHTSHGPYTSKNGAIVLVIWEPA